MQSLEDLRQRSRMVVLRLVAEAAGAPSDGQHQQHAHQDAGDPASHEQTANGDLADGAVHMAGAGVTAKPEQRSFCSAQNHTSFGVKLAYGVVFAGNPSKEKARNFSVHQEFQAFLIANWKFTAQSASSWGQVKEGSQMALFSFISLSMRLPFSRSRTSPYATLHNLPAIWCKSGVVVGVVDFRPKCPVYRSDLQRNGLWLPWWLLRKSPS